MIIKRKLAVLLLFLLPTLFVAAKDIPLDNKNIHVTGAPYITRTPAKLSYKRFSEYAMSAPDSTRMFSVPTANTTSGIVLGFKVKSSKIRLQFTQEAIGTAEKGSFRVLRNGAVYRTISFDAADIKKPFEFTLDSLPVNGAAVYEVILPSYSNVSLTGLQVDDNASLMPYKSSKKVYIGFGDSITHGRGQDGASYLTYPFQIAEKLNMDFYNQAIGGAKVSVPLAEKAGDIPQADVITILIGYNDLNGGSHTPQKFERDYRAYLSAIRKNQPKAKIFCINLLYTKKKENEKTHFTPDDFRNVIRKVVAEYQKSDKKLYLVEGDQLTSLANLQPGDKTDPVHLTVKGAAMFADALYKEMQKNL